MDNKQNVERAKRTRITKSPGGDKSKRSSESEERGTERSPRRSNSSGGRPSRPASGGRGSRTGAGSRSDRPASDRRYKREDGDAPKRSYNRSSDRPASDRRYKREDGDAPKRSYNRSSDRPTSDRRYKREDGDAPKRSYNRSSDRPASDRKYKREDGDAPKRSYNRSSDRPTSDRRYKREDGDAPKRSYNRSSDRPTSDRRYKREDGDAPKRSYTRPSDRPASDRRYKREDGDAPKRSYTRSSDRPAPSRKPAASKASSKKQISDDPNAVRLNKFIANSGVCSRREADEYISAGLVTVNGNIVTELGTKVKTTDDIRFNGERLKGEAKVYILMNKPKDVVTTTSDPHAEQSVMDLIGDNCPQRVYPVGRLDKSTTGVLLLTNDGELTEKLTHPSYNKKKIYHVFLNKKLKKPDFDQILEGVELEDGLIAADALSYVDEDESQVGIEIHSGRNRVVRRIFEHLGYKVKKLDRVYFAGLTKKNLSRGDWRYLTDSEVILIKTGKNE